MPGGSTVPSQAAGIACLSPRSAFTPWRAAKKQPVHKGSKAASTNPCATRRAINRRTTIHPSNPVTAGDTGVGAESFRGPK
jgi:hypothetical protein